MQRLEYASLRKHEAIFVKDGEELSCTPTIRHKVNTVDDETIQQRYHRIPPHQWAAVRQHLEELVNKGVIKESQSNYSPPIVIVPKKTGEICKCIDYRKLNTKVKADLFPLPWIEEVLEVLGGAKLFTTLDLASAYNQIEVEPSDQHKTAFITPMGLFEAIRPLWDSLRL